jgi:hypothetical protein
MRIEILIVLVTAIVGCAMAADSTLAVAPPMGWNSWNRFACKVTAEDVRTAADALASNGMKAAGYVYVNIDDCWQGDRDEQGRIRPNAPQLAYSCASCPSCPPKRARCKSGLSLLPMVVWLSAAQRLGTVHWKPHGRCHEARGDSAQDSVRRG